MDELNNARSKNDFKDMAYWPQILASVVVSLIFFNHAALTGYATEALPQLKFVFSKKATKIDEIFTVDLTLTT